MSAVRLAIVWHSRTGAARALAAAAADAAGESFAGGRGMVDLIAAELADPERLLAASAYLFVCPENLGAMSGPMKDLFDRTYYPLLERVEGRGYATIIAAGSAGEGAQAQLDRIVTGWRLRRVAEPMIVNVGAQTPAQILAPKQVAIADLTRARLLGAALAEGLGLGIF